ncbi:MAG: CHASE2 domain-containing protein [Bacteroidaceae bacterium]|nr:CHASE2 domain-containing protein [Bacteroidaceae bacterium]
MKKPSIITNKIILQLQKSLAAVGLSFIIVWGYAQIALNLSFLNPISEAIANFSITDKYYQMMPEVENRSLTIVDLTPLHDRGEIANVLEEIEACCPATIGVDCVFEGGKSDTLADDAIRSIAEQYHNIVFSYKLLNEQSDCIGYSRSVHSFFTDEIAVREGVANMYRDNFYTGIKRTLKLGWTHSGNKELSLVGEIVNLYAGTEVVTARDNDMNINFAPTHFSIVEPSEILQSRHLIEGRIVFLGALADEIDMHYTPIGKMSGVELLAYATQTLIEDRQIIELPMWLQVVVAVFLVMLTNVLQLLYLRWTSKSRSPLVFHVMGSAYMLGVVTFLWIALIMWGTFLCFNLYNVSVELGWPIAAMAFLSTSRSFYAACEDYYKIWEKRKAKKK